MAHEMRDKAAPRRLVEIEPRWRRHERQDADGRGLGRRQHPQAPRSIAMQKGYEAGLTPARLRDTGAQSLCAKISLADSSFVKTIRSAVNCNVTHNRPDKSTS